MSTAEQALARGNARTAERQESRAIKAEEAAKKLPKLTKFHIAFNKQKSRPWVVKGFGLRRRVTIIAATGGTGKTQFILQALFMWALGENFAGFTPMRRLKMLIVSGEEDRDELNLRLEAIAKHYLESKGKKFTEKNLSELMLKLDNYLWTYEPGEDGIPSAPLIEMGDKEIPVPTAFHAQLMADVAREKPDIVAFDPLISLHRGLSENNPGHMQSLSTAGRAVAIAGDCNVVFLHHTSQALAHSVNNAHAARGTTATGDAGRVTINMVSMSEADGKEYFPDDPEAYLDYVVIADPKQNYGRKSKPRWYKRVPVALTTLLEDNSTDFGFVFEAWEVKLPESSILVQPWLTDFLTDIDEAYKNGDAYLFATTSKGKRADQLLIQQYGMEPKLCRWALQKLVAKKMLGIEEVRKNNRSTKVYKLLSRTPVNPPPAEPVVVGGDLI